MGFCFFEVSGKSVMGAVSLSISSMLASLRSRSCASRVLGMERSLGSSRIRDFVGVAEKLE